MLVILLTSSPYFNWLDNEMAVEVRVLTTFPVEFDTCHYYFKLYDKYTYLKFVYVNNFDILFKIWLSRVVFSMSSHHKAQQHNIWYLHVSYF
jgi:hypothetical protein